MLSPDEIEALGGMAQQLTQPVTDFLIGDIAERIAQAGQLTSTAAYEVWQAQQMGLSQKELKKRLQKLLNLSSKELEELFTQAAKASYNGDMSRFPTVDAIPFAENGGLQQILKAAIELAQEDFSNITQTMGFVTPNGTAVGLTEAYRQSCDFAFQKVVAGAQDYASAIRDATRGLVEKGILRLDYESGVHTSVEAAVRRSVMGGLGLLDEKITRYNHDELGCDGWEISAHMGSAPDHEPYQGKQYSDAQYEVINNSLRRRIGTLNCGHAAMPIILGVNDPQYTDDELEDMRRKNEEGVTYEGRHMTLYEATQRQRSLERQIRKQKRRILVDEKTGDAEKLQTDQIRYRLLEGEYKKFSKAAGLRLQHERMEMPGFGAKQARAAEKVANNVFKNPPRDLQALSAKMDVELNRYCNRESKWSGKTIVLTREQMPRAKGKKEWNCDISLRDTAGVKTVIHEHLHARSVSYYTPEIYIEYRTLEEGTVELFAQEICKQNGVDFTEAYRSEVKLLCIINNILRNGDRYTFSKQLFDIPLPERYNWLRTQADALLETGKLSKKTARSLNAALDGLLRKRS